MDAATLPAVLAARARSTPDKTFVRCGSVSFTYAEMEERSAALARGLTELGIGRGDRVALLSVNRSEMVELYFGCAKVGAVQVPLNAFLKGEFLRYQLADSDATALVVDAAGGAAAAPLLADLPSLKHVVLLDRREAAASLDAAPVEVLQLDDLRAPGPATAVELTADDVMSIVYTSGTTGLPKGCVLTHGYYLRVGGVGIATTELTSDDVFLTALPMFHAAARMLVLAATLRAGASLVLEPEFRASTFLETARRTGATVTLGVGAMWSMLLQQPPGPGDRDHQLRVAVWTPADLELQDKVEQRFGISAVTQIYGQTECAGVTFSPASQERNRASGGRPAPDLEVQLVDDDDRPVPAGAVGEIVFRPREPHAMFREYWRKPEETLKAFRNLWYHTGDYGTADAQGFVSFVDRKKDALRRRGENVSSFELEAAIAGHPKVAEVAVHAVPSPLTEDDIKACIVLRAGEDITPEELFTFFTRSLPYFAVPRFVELLPELPRNAVARVMKHVLRDRGVTDATWDFEALGLTVSRDARRG